MSTVLLTAFVIAADQVDWVARIIALGGLFVAAASLVWQILKWWTERPRPEVDAGRLKNIDDGRTYPTITVRNAGGGAFSVEGLRCEPRSADIALRVPNFVRDREEAMRLGLEGYKRFQDFPLKLESGESAKWVLELVHTDTPVEVLPDDLVIAVDTSHGEARTSLGAPG